MNLREPRQPPWCEIVRTLGVFLLNLIRPSLLFLALALAALPSRAELPRGMAETFLDYLDENPFVVLVCLTEQTPEVTPAPHKHRVHFKGTVVRTIKGKWEIGTQLEWFLLVEANPTKLRNDVGKLKFLFLDEMPEGKFHLGTGAGWVYRTELDELLDQWRERRPEKRE